MDILVSIIMITYYIVLIIVILNIEKVNKERDKLNKNTLNLSKECIDLNRSLLKKLTEILIIIQSSEDAESRIEKIKEVIQSENENNF